MSSRARINDGTPDFFSGPEATPIAESNPANPVASVAGPEQGAAGLGLDRPPPPAPTETFVPVAALERMLALRHEQIFKWGHTLEADRARALNDFAADLHSIATAIREDVQFHKETGQIERRAIKLGALTMAFFDRLQAERGK